MRKGSGGRGGVSKEVAWRGLEGRAENKERGTVRPEEWRVGSARRESLVAVERRFKNSGAINK